MFRWSLAAAALVGLAAPASLRGELVCEAPLFQAGTVRSGAPLRHEFRLHNTGPDPVEVLEVHSGCGCLRSALARRTFAPGEPVLVLVDAHTLGQPEGPNTWRAVVRYRSGGRAGEVPLLVRALLVREVSVSPAALVLHTESTITAELTFLDRRDRPFEPRALLTSSRHVRASAREPRRVGEGWERKVTLEVTADCPEGRHDEVLVLHTGDTGYPELKVPFTIVKKARGRVTAVPAEVSLFSAGGGPLPSRIVLLGAARDQELKVERVETSDPALACRWAPGPGARVTLRITVDRSRLSGESWQGAVRLHLSRPTPQTVVVPVRCSLR
jgi:hypothetical protein